MGAGARAESLVPSNWTGMILAILISYLCHFYYRYITRENPLPGPLPLPLLGSAFVISRKLAAWTHRMQAKYGDIWEAYIGSKRSVFVTKNEAVEQIYGPGSSVDYFLRMDKNDGIAELDMAGKGTLMNYDWETWHANRLVITRALTSQKHLEDVIVLTQKIFKETEWYWNQFCPNTEIQFHEWSVRLTTDLMLMTTTGKRGYTLASYYEELVGTGGELQHDPALLTDSEDFLYSMSTWRRSLWFYLQIPRRIRHFIPGFTYFQNEYYDINRELNKIMNQIIEAKKKEVEKRVYYFEELGSDTLTTMLTANTECDTDAKAKAEKGQPLDDADICTNMKELFLMGIFKISQTFSSIVYHLCKYNKVKSKLIQEIDKILGANSSQTFSYEDIKKFTYLDAIIKEVIRLYPVVPLSFRTLKTDKVICGYKISAGTTLFTNFATVHQDKTYWKDPMQFNPDRFLQNDKIIDQKSFFPFGGGSRSCPGQYVAMAELKTLLIMLYTRYDVELVDDLAHRKLSFSGGDKIWKSMRVYIRRR